MIASRSDWCNDHQKHHLCNGKVMTNSNVCQVCGGKPSDRRLVTTVLNSEGKQIMKDTLKCLNSFHDGYGFTDQLPNEPKRNFTESIFNKPTPTSVEEQSK